MHRNVFCFILCEVCTIALDAKTVCDTIIVIVIVLFVQDHQYTNAVNKQPGFVAGKLIRVRNQKYSQGRPVPMKSWLQVTYPLLIAASLDTFCFVAPQP